MSEYKEELIQLDTYYPLYKSLMSGRSITLDPKTKEILYNIRLKIFGYKTNLSCSVCVKEMVTVLFNYYNQNRFKEESIVIDTPTEKQLVVKGGVTKNKKK
jgi:hypothetical protein